MKRFSVSSLRVRLILLVLVAVIPALGLLFYVAEEQRSSASLEAQQNALRLARLVSANQHDLIEGAHQLLTVLAQIPVVRGGEPTSCGPFLKGLLGEYPLYANFGVADLHGDIVCSAIPPKGLTNAADRAWFQRAFQSSGFAIGDYQVGRITGKAAINFGYPILERGGQVRAVVFAALDLVWFNKLAVKSHLPPGATVTVIDRRRAILTRYPDSKKWIGRTMPEGSLLKSIVAQNGEGTAEAVGPDGFPCLYGFASLGDGAVGASVLVGIPKDLAFASVNRILARSLALLMLVSVLALAGAWWGGDWLVVRKVKRLIKATERLAAGDLDARVGLPDDKGELHQLACAFDRMAEALQKQHTEAVQSQEELRNHLHQNTALREINVAITSTLDLQAELYLLMEKIDVFLPYTAVMVWLADEENKTLVRTTCWNLNEAEWKGREGKDTPSLVRAVAENKIPVSVCNIQTDPRTRHREFYRRNGLVSFLGVPLLMKGEILGVLAFLTREEHQFKNEEIEFLSALAAQTAVAIRNSQLYKQVRERTNALSALYAVASTANETLNLDAVLRAVIRQITEIFHFDATRIFLLEPETGELHLRDSFEARQGIFGIRKVIRLGIGINGMVAESGEPIIFEDVQRDPRYRKLSQTQATRENDFSFFAVFPIKAKQKVVGTIVCIGEKPRRLKTEEIQLIVSMTDSVGVAIENAVLFERTKNQALELEKANQVKDEFLGFVSHELKTPVNVVMGYASLLQSNTFGEINSDQAKALEKMIANSRDLQNMINTLLEATKIKAGAAQMEIGEVNVGDFFEELKSAYDVPLDKELRLVWDYPSDLPVMKTDGDKLRHILQNLINNAIKYTDHGSVTVSASHLLGSNSVEFSVTDTGIGISDEALPFIFEMFRQVNGSETRSAGGGVGLGLHIVKKFTELLGGEIKVESDLGKGSTFMLTLRTGAEASDLNSQDTQSPHEINVPCNNSV